MPRITRTVITESDEPKANSRKREATAVVITTVVGVVLTGVAMKLVDALEKKVHDSIAKPAIAEKTEEENN